MISLVEESIFSFISSNQNSILGVIDSKNNTDNADSSVQLPFISSTTYSASELVSSEVIVSLNLNLGKSEKPSKNKIYLCVEPKPEADLKDPENCFFTGA